MLGHSGDTLKKKKHIQKHILEVIKVKKKLVPKWGKKELHHLSLYIVNLAEEFPNHIHLIPMAEAVRAHV